MPRYYARSRNGERWLIWGQGPSRFDHLNGQRVAVDHIRDNGDGQGYSIYRRRRQGMELVGFGDLVIYDEIDKEEDVIYGGPMPSGWVSHFPDNYSAPSSDIIARYKETKSSYRLYLAVEIARQERIQHPATGRRVYKLARADPTAYYGLYRPWLMSSDFPHAIGLKGEKRHYPTTLNWKPTTQTESPGDMVIDTQDEDEQGEE